MKNLSLAIRIDTSDRSRIELLDGLDACATHSMDRFKVKYFDDLFEELSLLGRKHNEVLKSVLVEVFALHKLFLVFRSPWDFGSKSGSIVFTRRKNKNNTKAVCCHLYEVTHNKL